MPRKTVGYVRLEWTCPNCGTRNPGPQKTCSNCGAPQPENVKFETGPDQELIKDEQSIRAARAGADFICPYCGTRNRGDARVCTQCGGDLVEAKLRASGAELESRKGLKEITCTNCGTVNPAANINCLKCGAPLPRPAATASATAGSAGSAPAGAKKKTNWLLLGGIGAALLVCCAAILFLFVFPSSSVQATVADVYWQTSVPVQEIRAIDHSNEAGSPPSDAYNVSCHTESREVCTEKIVDQGNGYGEKVQDCHDESQDYCSYTVDEWQTIQTYTLDGHDYSPDFSQPSLTSGQRLGNESATYTAYFGTSKGVKTYSPASLSEFQQFTIGSTWTLKLNALGGVVSVGR
jgi:DNA-directed RNA polymerase subunit RPC12/RpoP